MFVGFSQANELVDYQLGAGDVVGISVYGEPDLSVTSKVSKTGTIDVPLIGVVNAKGITVNVLKDKLVKAFKDGYLVSPQVTVIINEYRPFFIYGAVRLSGSFSYQAGLTVEQAIALAGGLKERASNSEWYILRDGSHEKQKAQRETSVLPGDVIKIEQSIF